MWRVAEAIYIRQAEIQIILFPCSFRHWLCNTGDWGPSKCVLHHHLGMGHFLPEQLLHHWAPLGHLWAWVEHRYGPEGGFLWNWGCVFVLETNPGLWLLYVTQISLKLEVSSALCLGPFCGLQPWRLSWALVEELACVGDEDAFSLLCQIQRLSLWGQELRYEGFRLQFQPCL